MKEKIWIEKLYELLFDYSRNKGYYWTLRQSGKIEWDVRWTDHTLEDEEVSMVIKSKEFWFIKWLVENDKIDTSKANDKNLNGYEIELRIRAVKELVADSEEKTVLYLNLLMLLSISDTPIEDLISYLK